VISLRVNSAGFFGCSEVVRTGALLTEKIIGVDELAQAQRQAATADTAAQSVPQVLQADDPLIQVVPPRRGEPLPIPTGWRASARGFARPRDRRPTC
jgi:hypothetical protein